LIQVHFSSSTPPSGAVIEIPILTKSPLTSTEGYTFFYQTVPYQGQLDSSSYGKIESVGPAVVTTAGSGTITDYTYSTGTASVSEDGTVVSGSGTQWLSTVKEGYALGFDNTVFYKISDVYDNGTIILESAAKDSGSGSYTIKALDQPSFNQPNIIDRMPTFSANNDSFGKNDNISISDTEGYPILETRITSRVQDISDIPANEATIGENTAGRGRSKIALPSDQAPFGLGNLGLSFSKLEGAGSAYKKTYQSYLLNRTEDGTTGAAVVGNLYLMVAGSETDNSGSKCFLNERSNSDSVDLFQIPGRPIVTKRTI
jgi:hypothetical protein